MPIIPPLKPGDTVEIVAPASRCSDQQLASLKSLLESWQLQCIVEDNIMGDDLLFANTDDARFHCLKNALHRSDTKAVICVRGGYGSMRLIPALSKILPPKTKKFFVGMSDITALNLFLQQSWQWPIVHGHLNSETLSPESIASVKALLFGDISQVSFTGLPLNEPAAQNRLIEAPITGGNLAVIQAGIGTIWQIKGKKKIVLFEDVGERAYRIDRMLTHLHQATLLDEIAAIVFGDFTKGEEPDGSSLVMPMLQQFANCCHIPVVKIKGVGHGHINFPVLMGAGGGLQLGENVVLTAYST